MIPSTRIPSCGAKRNLTGQQPRFYRSLISSEDGTIRFRDANQDQLTPAGMVVAQPQLRVVAYPPQTHRRSWGHPMAVSKCGVPERPASYSS